jgi:transposase
MEKNKCGNRYSPEVRERAVRMVFEHEGEFDSQSAAIKSIAPKIGCGPDTLRAWVRRAETDSGRRDGVTTAEQDRIKALERETRQLRQANEILKKASAYFAQAELVLWDSRLLMQKGAAARHRKLRGSGGGGVVRSLVFQDRGRV